jgi:hypothetical protein
MESCEWTEKADPMVVLHEGFGQVQGRTPHDRGFDRESAMWRHPGITML